MDDTLSVEEFDMMVGSKSEDEWNDNCLKIKKAHGGKYPRDWYQKLIASGIAEKVANTWGGTMEIQIRSF